MRKSFINKSNNILIFCFTNSFFFQREMYTIEKCDEIGLLMAKFESYMQVRSENV